jgi:hypothetical protein
LQPSSESKTTAAGIIELNQRLDAAGFYPRR